MSIKTRITTRKVTRIFALGIGALSCSLMLACGEDSVLGDDEAFMSESTGGNGNLPTGPLEPNDCDMTGTWMAQINTVSYALGELLTARSYNWFYYELDDTGDEVIVERGWDCSFVVCDITQIEITPDQSAALSLHNRQDGVLKADPDNIMEPISPDFVVEPRGMTYRKNDDGTCEFSMDRWWWVRSASLDFLPDRSDYSTMTVGQIQQANPLPESVEEIPSGDAPPKANEYTLWDWDEDGKIGLNLQLDRPMPGWRDSIQRDWNQVPPARIADGSVDFTVPAQFDNEEALYDASASLLDQVSTPAQTGHTFRFVKVSDKAPEDLPGFIQYCQTQVDALFREETKSNYCDMRTPELNDNLGNSGGEEGTD